MLDMPPEVVCMARTIQGEAGGESTAGKEAVAQVILNRSKRQNRSICQIVQQKGQFYGYYNSRTPSQVSISVAIRALANQIINRVGNRLYFNTTGPARAMRIGNHLFW